MLVSIITVVYNNEDNISAAIRSVLSQRYPFIEYIVIDGGSKDGTLNEIYPYLDDISVFVSEPDNGIYDALNKGIRLASGEIVGILHSDDIFSDEGVISSVVENFLSSKLDVLYGDLVYISASENVVRYWRAGQFSIHKLKYGWMPPHPTVFVTLKKCMFVGGYNINYKISSDYDFLLRLLKADGLAVGYLPKILVKMRLGGASNSLSNIVRKSSEDYLIVKRNSVGGLVTLFLKNITKLTQFIN